MVYDFDFPEATHHPQYRAATPSSPSYAHQMYPRMGSQRGPTAIHPAAGRPSPYQPHHPPPPSPTSSSSSLGVRVAIKPEYRITPPPQSSHYVGDIPRSNFQFDFDFERKILAEAEKENPNWGRVIMENLPLRTAEPVPTPMQGQTGDPVVTKYIASGLNREAVSLALSKYGDNPNKVREFAKGYSLIRDMGFSSSSVAEALAMNDNDSEKALTQLLSGSS